MVHRFTKNRKGRKLFRKFARNLRKAMRAVTLENIKDAVIDIERRIK